MKNKNIKTKIASIVLATVLLFSAIVSTSQAECDGGCYHPNIAPVTSNWVSFTDSERSMLFEVKQKIQFLEKIIKLKIENKNLEMHISLDDKFAILIDNSKADKNNLFFDYLNETRDSKKIKKLPDTLYNIEYREYIKDFNRIIRNFKSSKLKSLKIYKNSKVITVWGISLDKYNYGERKIIGVAKKTFEKISFKNHLEKNTFRIKKEEDETIKIVAFLETKDPVFANLFYQLYEKTADAYPENRRTKSKVIGYDKQKELYKHEINYDIPRSWLKFFKKHIGDDKFKVFELTLADFDRENEYDYIIKKLIFLDPRGFQNNTEDYK